MEENQSHPLYNLPADLITAILAAVDPLEDLLHLSTSCRLFRNTLDPLFWHQYLADRGLDRESYHDPRKTAIFNVTKTCHDCRSISEKELRPHYLVKKRLCGTCRHNKCRTITNRVIVRSCKYKITNEQLASLPRVMLPGPHNCAVMHFLLTDTPGDSRTKTNSDRKAATRTRKSEVAYGVGSS